MLAGLLAGSGVGLLILFRIHKNIKEDLLIAAVIYGSGVARWHFCLILSELPFENRRQNHAGFHKKSKRLPEAVRNRR